MFGWKTIQKKQEIDTRVQKWLEDHKKSGGNSERKAEAQDGRGDISKPVKPETKKAEAEAQYNLGKKHFTDNRGEKDSEEAFKCFDKAAEYNHPKAQFYLGVMYRKGQGV